MNQTMNRIGSINPVTDDQAARLLSPDTREDLAWLISATPVSATAGPRRGRARTGARRRFLLAVPMAAALGAAAVLVIVANHPGATPRAVQSGQPGTVRIGPDTAQALSFTTNAGGGLTVIVRDPLADPAVYRAEFAAHHLNITLRLRPVSPSLVGTVFYLSEPSTGPQIVPITAKGKCVVPSGGDDCPVGVKIPAGFRGQAEVDFGRAARPGEQYVSAGSAFAPGEALYGMNIKGETVAHVVAQLRERHVTVAYFNKEGSDGNQSAHQVPGSWYVYEAIPWAPGQVMLFVGPTATEPATGQPVPAAPAATPSA